MKIIRPKSGSFFMPHPLHFTNESLTATRFTESEAAQIFLPIKQIEKKGEEFTLLSKSVYKLI
jgi:hypothetical protein